MLVYATKEELDSYYESDALNQSQLKKLLVDLDFLKSTKESQLYFEEKESFVIGSLVDFQITRGNEDISDYYYVSEIKNKPSDAIVSIINNLVDYIFENNIEVKDINSPEYTDILFEIIEKHNYCKTFTKDVRLNKIYAESEYYTSVVNSRGKQVISKEEFFLASRISENIKELSLIKKCFEEFATSSDIIVYFQKPLYFTIKKRKCKALPDIIIHNTVTNSIFIIDIKTTSDKTLNFLIAIKKFRYDIQMAWYREACKSIFNTSKIVCLFAVESTVRQGNAVILKVEKDLLESGLYGLEEIYYKDILIRREQKGINQLLDLYQYYEDNEFREEKIIAESSPYKVLKVGINKIY